MLARVCAVASFLASTGGVALAASPPPLSTVRALEGSGEVTLARLEAIGRTKRVGWDPAGAGGAAYTGITLDEVVASLRIEGDVGERSDAIGVFERFASPDPELHRPPMIALTTPGAEFRGVVESLSYECAEDHCDVRLALVQTDAPSIAEARDAKPRDTKSVSAAKAVSADEGYLTLDTYPWTRVSEDGRDLGTTPLVRVALSPGVHKLVLENRLLGIRQSYSVTVKNGQAIARRLGLR
jgi:hypothetical protein